MNIGVIPFCNTPIPPTTKMFEKNPLDTPTTGILDADLVIYFYTQWKLINIHSHILLH